MTVDLRIDVAVDLHDVGPAVVVVIHKATAPRDILIVDADAGSEGDIGEGAVAVVVIEVAGVVGKIGFEDVKPAIAIVVGDSEAHTCLFVAVVAVRAAGDDGDIRERSIVIVLQKDAGLRIDGDVDVGPAVVIKIVRNCGDGVAATGFEDAGSFGNIGERAVTIVAIEDVGVAGEATRAAHDRNAFPLAEWRAVGIGSLCRIKFDVVADEEVEITVAVVIEKSAAGAPANFIVVKACLFRDVGEGAVAVVAKQDVVTPEGAEEIIPAVIVVVTDANACLPPSAPDAGFFRNVGECAITIVLVKMCGGSLPLGPFLAEECAVREVYIEPAVMIVIEEGDSGALGFNDVFLGVGIAPDVGSGEAGFVGDVNILDGGFCGIGFCGLEEESGFPAPERSGEGVEERRAKCREGRAEEAAAGKDHLEGILGKLRGTMPTPSLMARILSTGMSLRRSTWPLGQVISSRSILVRLPRPKWIRGSLADM